MYAVVKDNAYGHGAIAVALTLEDEVFAFAVATVEEGVALRVGGVRKDILVLTPPLCEEEVVRCAGYQLVVTVSSIAILRMTARAVEKYHLSLRAHFAINTGMNRFGLRPDRVRTACREALSTGILFEGVYSHLYAAEEKSERERQRLIFTDASERVREFFPTVQRHLSATGGILSGEEYRFDAVRCGIGLYGYLPRAFEGAVSLKRAMRVYTHAVQSHVAFGGGMGYMSAKRQYGSVKTLRFGYGDGLLRAQSFLSHGNLCMDAHIRDGRAKAGQRVRLLTDLQAYAEEMNTIIYEVLCMITKRAEIIYE